MPRAGVATIGHNRGMDGDVGGRLPQGAQETAGRRSGPRLLAAGALGLITGGVVLVTARHIDFALALGWSVAALAYLARTWWVIGRMDAVSTARHATVEDASNVLTLELVVLLASVASLVAVGFLLVGGDPSERLGRGLLGVFAVVVSWVLVHTVFTVRYARLYYTGPDGGIDFPGGEHPQYSDFAYLAFTLGMTYQVSDTALQAKAIRREALTHALLSYLFGTVVVASTVNLVIGLAAAH